MSELCRFAGLVIYMMFYDTGKHNKPHIHVSYGEYEAVIAVDGELLAGYLPPRLIKLVRRWLKLREEEVYKAWNLAVNGKHYGKIDPVKY